MFASVIAFCALISQPKLEIRSATFDISPTEAMPLGGYTERLGKLNEPGGDKLYARVIVFRQGNTKIALVSAEMLTIPESLVTEVRKRVPKDINVFMAATHTHCAPDSQMLNDRMTLNIPGIANFKRKVLDRYSELISTAIKKTNSTKPLPKTELTLIEGSALLTHARRPQDQPEPGFGVIQNGGLALVSHYAAHPIFYEASELKTRGDWPGLLAQKGGLVLQGAIGDVSPNLDKRPPEEQIKDFVEKLLASLSNQKVENLAPIIGWNETPIELLKPTPHPSFSKTYRIPDPLARLAVLRFAPPQATITTIKIGDVAIVGIPGEPTAVLGRQIVEQGKKLGFAHVLVTSHVNGWMGYILDPEDYDRGGYEATLSLYGRDEANHVVKAAVDSLRQLSGGQ